MLEDCVLELILDSISDSTFKQKSNVINYYNNLVEQPMPNNQQLITRMLYLIHKGFNYYGKSL
jgi:hypothetical protein